MTTNDANVISSWKRPWSLDEIVKSSNCWSLAADSGVCELLKSFSTDLLNELSQVNNNVTELSIESRQTNVLIQNAFNDFCMLANDQFMENLVEDVASLSMVNINSKENFENLLNKEDKLAQIIPQVSETLKLGMLVLDNQFEILEVQKKGKTSVNQDDSDSEVPITVSPSEYVTNEPIYQPKDPYENRHLPHLIGTVAFVDDDTLGIGYLDDDVEELEDDISSDSERVNGLLNGDISDGLSSSDESQLSTHSEKVNVPIKKPRKTLSSESDNIFDNKSTNLSDDDLFIDTNIAPSIKTVNEQQFKPLTLQDQLQSQLKKKLGLDPLDSSPSPDSFIENIVSDKPLSYSTSSPQLSDKDIRVVPSKRSTIPIRKFSDLADDEQDDDDIFSNSFLTKKDPIIKSNAKTNITNSPIIPVRNTIHNNNKTSNGLVVTNSNIRIQSDNEEDDDDDDDLFGSSSVTKPAIITNTTSSSASKTTTNTTTTNTKTTTRIKSPGLFPDSDSDSDNLFKSPPAKSQTVKTKPKIEEILPTNTKNEEVVSGKFRVNASSALDPITNIDKPPTTTTNSTKKSFTNITANTTKTTNSKPFAFSSDDDEEDEIFKPIPVNSRSNPVVSKSSNLPDISETNKSPINETKSEPYSKNTVKPKQRASIKTISESDTDSMFADSSNNKNESSSTTNESSQNKETKSNLKSSESDNESLFGDSNKTNKKLPLLNKKNKENNSKNSFVARTKTSESDCESLFRDSSSKGDNMTNEKRDMVDKKKTIDVNKSDSDDDLFGNGIKKPTTNTSSVKQDESKKSTDKSNNVQSDPLSLMNNNKVVKTEQEPLITTRESVPKLPPGAWNMLGSANLAEELENRQRKSRLSVLPIDQVDCKNPVDVVIKTIKENIVEPTPKVVTSEVTISVDKSEINTSELSIPDIIPEVKPIVRTNVIKNKLFDNLVMKTPSDIQANTNKRIQTNPIEEPPEINLDKPVQEIRQLTLLTKTRARNIPRRRPIVKVNDVIDPIIPVTNVIDPIIPVTNVVDPIIPVTNVVDPIDIPTINKEPESLPPLIVTPVVTILPDNVVIPNDELNIFANLPSKPERKTKSTKKSHMNKTTKTVEVNINEIDDIFAVTNSKTTKKTKSKPKIANDPLGAN